MNNIFFFLKIKVLTIQLWNANFLNSFLEKVQIFMWYEMYMKTFSLRFHYVSLYIFNKMKYPSEHLRSFLYTILFYGFKNTFKICYRFLLVLLRKINKRG